MVVLASIIAVVIVSVVVSSLVCVHASVVVGCHFRRRDGSQVRRRVGHRFHRRIRRRVRRRVCRRVSRRLRRRVHRRASCLVFVVTSAVVSVVASVVASVGSRSVVVFDLGPSLCPSSCLSLSSCCVSVFMFVMSSVVFVLVSVCPRVRTRLCHYVHRHIRRRALGRICWPLFFLMLTYRCSVPRIAHGLLRIFMHAVLKQSKLVRGREKATQAAQRCICSHEAAHDAHHYK